MDFDLISAWFGLGLGLALGLIWLGFGLDSARPWIPRMHKTLIFCNFVAFDAFWGDRVFQVSDVNGYEWMFAKSL